MARVEKLWISGAGAGKNLRFAQENSVEKLVIVEKLWRNLWDSLWETCGKVLHMMGLVGFCTENVAKVGVFHDVVEKFCRGICTWNYRGKSGVLHSFHSPYYYYY